MGIRRRASKIIFIICVLLIIVCIYATKVFLDVDIWLKYMEVKAELKYRQVIFLTINNKLELPKCKYDRSVLAGRLYVDQTIPTSFEKLENTIGFVNPGGWWKPSHCIPQKQVAIIIPYRERKDNLLVLLRHLNPILRRQQLDYQIFVIEQVDTYPFNKAKLLNIGYTISQKYRNFDCIIFHDADFLPINDYNRYDCPTSPRLMSPACDKFDYHFIYESYLGGVVALNKQDVEETNGWSNRFYGWGGEDDDLYWRLKQANKNITYANNEIGRYNLADHKLSSRNSKSGYLVELTINSTVLIENDGLSTLRYKLVAIKEQRFFTLIGVNLTMNPMEYNLTTVIS